MNKHYVNKLHFLITTMLALFYSGGKDSHFVLCKLVNEYGIKPDYLLYVKPSRFSIHELNEHLIVIHSKLLNIPLITTNIKDMEKTLIKYNITDIVAADVLIEDHVNWLIKICEKLRINLVEPLLNYDTFSVLRNCVLSDIEFIIIDIVNSCKSLLGVTVSKNTIDKVIEQLSNCEIDWIGEFGEYHTLVLKSQIMKKRIEILNYKKYCVRDRTFIVITQFKLVGP